MANNNYLYQISGKFQEYFSMEIEQTRKTRLFEVSPLMKSIVAILWLLYIDYILPNLLTDSNRVLKYAYICGIISIVHIFFAIILKIQPKTFFKFILTLGIGLPIIIIIPGIFLVTPNSNSTVLLSAQILGIRISISRVYLLNSIELFMRLFSNSVILGLFILSTPFIQIIHSLHHIKFPQIFITILILTYRYFYLFFENIVKIMRADATRRFSEYKFKERFKHLGTLFGMLLLGTIHRGESIHRSMLARGYVGTIPVVGYYSVNWKTLIYVIAEAGLFLIAVLLI